MSVEAEIFRGKGPREVENIKTEITRQRSALSQDAVIMGLVPYYNGFFWADPAYEGDWYNQKDRKFTSLREEIVDGVLKLVQYKTQLVTEENRDEEINNRLKQVLLLSANYNVSYWDKFKGIEMQNNSPRKLRRSRSRRK